MKLNLGVTAPRAPGQKGRPQRHESALRVVISFGFAVAGS